MVRDALRGGEDLPSESELAAHVGAVGTQTMYAEHDDVVVVGFLAGGLVYAGANSAKPHGLPSAYRLRPGDTFMLSLGCAVGGRFVEGERTFILGRADQRPAAVLRGSAGRAAGRHRRAAPGAHLRRVQRAVPRRHPGRRAGRVHRAPPGTRHRRRHARAALAGGRRRHGAAGGLRRLQRAGHLHPRARRLPDLGLHAHHRPTAPFPSPPTPNRSTTSSSPPTPTAEEPPCSSRSTATS